MKKKILLTSILSIFMCLTIIGGSTFALFTSTDTVNVAVTSATVKVTARVDEDPVLSSTLGENLPQTTATLDGNSITVTNMVPGDKVDFTINVYNESTVTVKYRTVINIESDGLYDVLEVSVDDKLLSGATTKENWWQEIDPATDSTVAIETVPVSIYLPEEIEDEIYQTKNMTLTFTVQAIQGNAYTGPKAQLSTFAKEDLPASTNINTTTATGWLGSPEITQPVVLEAAYAFEATETEESLAASKYKDWICDFVIECDSDIATGELGLVGEYGSWGWLAFLNPMDVSANEKVPMLTSVNRGFTYETICNDVTVFNCGLFRGNTENAMNGKTVTVTLCLFNTETFNSKYTANIQKFVEDGFSEEEATKKARDWSLYVLDEDYLIVNTTSYTFADLSANG